MKTNPSFCILFYEETTRLSEDLNYYLELGTFHEENIVSVKPFSVDDIRNLSEILKNDIKSDVSPSFQFINKHIVFSNESTICWYAEHNPKQLYYVIGSKNYSKKVELPKILFVLNRRLNMFSVYFLIKEDGINSVFYKPNLPNYNSSVCIGNNKIKGKNENEILNSIEEIFFKSPFTAKLINIHKWKKNEITLKKILNLK